MNDEKPGNNLTPSGDWYLTGHAPQAGLTLSEDSDDYLLFRKEPVRDKVEALYNAFGKAAQNMPLLETASVYCWIQDPNSDSQQLGMAYRAPEKEAYFDTEDEVDANFRRVHYEFGDYRWDWRLNEEILRLYRKIGSKRHPAPMKEHFYGIIESL